MAHFRRRSRWRLASNSHKCPQKSAMQNGLAEADGPLVVAVTTDSTTLKRRSTFFAIVIIIWCPPKLLEPTPAV